MKTARLFVPVSTLYLTFVNSLSCSTTSTGLRPGPLLDVRTLFYLLLLLFWRPADYSVVLITA